VFLDEQRGLEVWIDDDGLAAYALMRSVGSGATTLGWVWLYNHPKVDGGVAPAHEKPPVLEPNPAENVVEAPFEPIASDGELEVEFGGGPGLEAYAEIYIRSKFHAYLEARARTGWCILAKKSSSVAKPMIVTPEPDGTDDVHLVDYEGE
jgi:hypothetical protein